MAEDQVLGGKKGEMNSSAHVILRLEYRGMSSHKNLFLLFKYTR